MRASMHVRAKHTPIALKCQYIGAACHGLRVKAHPKKVLAIQSMCFLCRSMPCQAGMRDNMVDEAADATHTHKQDAQWHAVAGAGLAACGGSVCDGSALPWIV